jgi:glycosyltransferase involved in cell wall biosynthesis
LEAQAKECGAVGRIKFLGWRTDRGALLRAADLCVFASRVEPFGNVFVQAWAQKTPLVVSDSEGPKQFCRNGEDCLMVPKNDPAALRSTIVRMLGDKDLQRTLTENGYRRYLEEFTKERSIAAYQEFFLDILQKESIL